MRAQHIHLSPATGWLASQVTGVVLTAVLLIALVRWADSALRAFWYVAVPLLPASFLLSPAIWRNVCPLATLNTLANGLGGRRRLSNGVTVWAGAVGIVLFALLVPARRFVFNTDGPVLAGTIVAVGLVALVLGAVFDLKAGFCNAICPVLPVERLYGQRPFLGVGNPRCWPCTLCTPSGCIDLAPAKSIAQTLGPARRGATWLLTPFGLFAAALPGFIYGYFTIADTTWHEAAAVYRNIGRWSLVSAVIVGVLAFGLRLSAARVMPTLAAAAAGLYYWFTPPAVLRELGWRPDAAVPLRMVLLGLVVVWWGRAVRVSRRVLAVAP